MAAFLDSVAVSSRPLLWLDYSAYAGRLLAGNNIAWLDVSALVAWQRKAQGLLKSEVVGLPIAPLIGAWLQQYPHLVTSMGSKRRALFPLKTLLADEALRAHLVEALSGLRSCFQKMPLALVIPSPRHWVALAYEQALGTAAEIEIGADETDSAAMYVADFLRVFGESGIDVLLLEETPESEPEDEAEIEWYRPLLNICQHYRWDCGLRLPQAQKTPDAVAGVGFVIAPRALPGVVAGLAVSQDFWNSGVAPDCPQGAFRFVEIPVEANPEVVLDRLAVLR